MAVPSDSAFPDVHLWTVTLPNGEQLAGWLETPRAGPQQLRLHAPPPGVDERLPLTGALHLAAIEAAVSRRGRLVRHVHLRVETVVTAGVVRVQVVPEPGVDAEA